MDAKNAYVTVAIVEEDIFYLTENEKNFCASHSGSLNRYYTTINCTSAVTGQFVQIEFNTTYAVNLYEIEVHGV